MAAFFDSLSLAEQARQLANPEGPAGVEVARWLNRNNKEGNARTLGMLDLRPGQRVLEVGFGNGCVAADVVGAAPDVQYDGVDISPTMVEEARRANPVLVAAGRARFHLADAACMPFEDAAFDRAFSTGVIHFWEEPLAPLAELRRVMRPGALAVLGALDAVCPPPFARPEFGFHLRREDEWAELCRRAGFVSVATRALVSEQIGPDGSPIRRHTIRVNLHR